MVEAGESRTQVSTTEAAFNSTSPVSYPPSGSIPESSFRQVYGRSNPETDPSELLRLLLDQLAELGQTAQLVRQAIDNNSHRQDQITELIQLLSKGGTDAP
ncbi:hypothetical protein ACFLWS_08735 [Chloroflexota bacterium]